MRLPVVMTDANRAISAPINIWNDQQDVMVTRDAGWIMLFGETVQEVCDLHVLAYKVAEQLLIPVMVNLDGFVLTHVVEPVDVPEKEKVKKY
jgi:pyruvate ferredoxin oxidoreductase alpha subunit